MEIIFHIGLSKTGTTAIQDFLYRNKDVLVKYGLLYPNTGLIGSGHHAFPRKIKGGNFNYLERTFIEEVEKYKNNCSKVIVSSEEFMWLYASQRLKQLFNYLNANKYKVKIIIYIRRQDRWLESIYSQLIKMGNYQNLSEFLQKDPHMNIACYDKLLHKWQELKNIKINPRIYDKKLLPNGNVILDFLSIIGIDNYPEEKIKLEANPSLSHISTLVMRKFNEGFDFPSEVHKKIVSFLIELDRKYKHPLKTFFSLKERIEFLERFRESNEKLFREWFNSENKFVLSEEEIEFYKQQDEILKDKEKLEKDINERYEQVLEFIKQIEPNFDKYRKENVARVQVLVSKEPYIYGHVDIMNNNKIAGWVLDLKEIKPADVILKINGIQVIEKKANLERKDIKEKFNVNINTGFEIFWKEIVLPKEIKSLPDDAICNVEIFHKGTNKLIQGNYRTFTVRELKKLTRVSREFPWIRYVLNDEAKELIEFINIDQLYIDVLKEGRLTIGGLVVLRKEFPKEGYKLTLRVSGKEIEVNWNNPSLGYASKHPDNPNAERARFHVKDIPPEYPIELVLKKEQKRYILVIILR